MKIGSSSSISVTTWENESGEVIVALSPWFSKTVLASLLVIPSSIALPWTSIVTSSAVNDSLVL